MELRGAVAEAFDFIKVSVEGGNTDGLKSAVEVFQAGVIGDGGRVPMATDGEAKGEVIFVLPGVNENFGGDAVAGFEPDAETADGFFSQLDGVTSAVDEEAR